MMNDTERRSRANELHAEAMELSNEGDEDAALSKYLQALELDFSRPSTHYNIGLIYKYRHAWQDSLRYNRRARELAPKDEAAAWNLAIAATALRDWKTAREVWNGLGMSIGLGEDAIDADFGITPIRLDPDGEAEVVWAQRICPVRARIVNIPFPDSGLAYNDVVLHDGAPVGTRRDRHGNEQSVFNMLELFEPSNFSTFVVYATVAEDSGVPELEQLCEATELVFEDWTSSIRVLCRTCSEGRADEAHDHSPTDSVWQSERRIAIAARDKRVVHEVLDQWGGKGRQVTEWGIGLDRNRSMS